MGTLIIALAPSLQSHPVKLSLPNIFTCNVQHRSIITRDTRVSYTMFILIIITHEGVKENSTPQQINTPLRTYYVE